MPTTSSNYQAVISSGGAVIAHQFPPTNYPVDVDPVTRVTECDYGTECPCIGIIPGSSATPDGTVITVSEATLNSAGIVKTCNTSTGNATSDAVSLVPTQYYVQSEVTRLEGLISSASSTTIVSSTTVLSNGPATLESAGIVKTCGTSVGNVTSDTLDVVPTQYYLQSEVTRLEGLISSTGGGSQTVNAWNSTTDFGIAESASFEAGSSYLLDVSEGNHTITAITSSGLVTGPNSKVTLYLGSLSNLTVRAPLTLKGDLQEYSMNACTLYFLNGVVYLVPDFSMPGFSVTLTTGSDAIGYARGSLQYALSSASHPIVSFDDVTNDSVCVIDGATNTIEKTVLGNGVDHTAISGTFTLGQPCTFSSLAIQDVTFGGASASFENVRFDSCVNNNGIKLSGSNVITDLSGSGAIILYPGACIQGPGTIDMLSKHTIRPISANYGDTYSFNDLTITNGANGNLPGGGCVVSQGNITYFNNCSITHCSAITGIAVDVAYHGSAFFSNCAIVDNSGGKGTVNINGMGRADFVSCVISSNTANSGGAIFNIAASSASVLFSDCVLHGTMQLNGGPSYVTFSGTNTWNFGNTKQSSTTTFRIVSGGTLDITDNAGDNHGNIMSNANGGVVVGYFDGTTWIQGGTATVINSAGTPVTIEGSGTALNKTGTLS